MKKKTTKKYIIAVVIVMLIIIGFYWWYYNNLINTANDLLESVYTTELKDKGYNDNEIAIINTMDQEKQDIILAFSYKNYMIALLNAKYFIARKIDLYITQIEESNDTVDRVISLVNTNSIYQPYTNIIETDLSLEYLILVNKYHQLKSNYVPSNLIAAFNGSGLLVNTANNALLNMTKAANEANITVYARSTYRSYNDQNIIYNDYVKGYGEVSANTFSAKPGHSEHQTGLAIDFRENYNASYEDFAKTPAFTWLIDNAYKYGFILRYPEAKEAITGYKYEAWHYRYVGVEVATYIKTNNITFDEYYAYYLDK